MLAAIAAWTFASVCGLVLTPLVRDVAIRRRVLDDHFNSRTIHSRPVPRLGGVAISMAFFAPLAIVFAIAGRAVSAGHARLFAGLVAGGLVVAAIGFCDDLRGVRARTKFVVQLGAAALAWAAGFRIEEVMLPFVGAIHLGAFGLPLTILWIAGIINALNLIDGLDGLAGGVALVVLVSFFGLSLGRGDPLLMILTGTLAGAVIGFLYFNVHPASIFMGDTGSMLIGYVLALVSLEASRTSTGSVALLVPVIALGYPVADTLLAMARRLARGVPMFSADRGHIHHRILAHGFSQRDTTLILCLATAILCGAASFVLGAPEAAAVDALAAILVLVVAAMGWLGFLDVRKVHDVAVARHRNLELRHRVARVASRLHGATDAETLGVTLAELAPALALDHVALRAAGRSWIYTVAGKKDLHVVRYPLDPETASGDLLEVGWTRRSLETDRDTEIAVERLCPHVRAALRRVVGRSRWRPVVLALSPVEAPPPSAAVAPDPLAAPLGSRVQGQRALVTGAAGQIGGEVCRQLAAAGVAELVMVDMNANELFVRARELEFEYPSVTLFPEIADVRDYERLVRLGQQHRPQLVFHAAAHKQVRLVEDAPEEAVKNNVFGTLNVAIVAQESGADRCVVMSTDRAANPTTVVGATKRISELVVQDLARRTATRMVAVRFGDVVESAGSLALQKTDAVRLALLAGLGDHGDVCLLDTASEPGGPLAADATEEVVRIGGRLGVAKGPPPPADLAKQLHLLQELAIEGAREPLLASVGRLVPTYRRTSREPLTAREPGSSPPTVVPEPAANELPHVSGTPVPTPALALTASSDIRPMRRLPTRWMQWMMTR